MTRKLLPILLILLLALTLRVYRLSAIPPGLTHDEANHGREAVGILDGELRYYFPLNYGSEPLYSYTVAGAMALLGENLLALRLVNVLFGLAAIGATYFWARRAFDRRTALLAAALMAVSFWPLASSRQALRAGMLPFFTVTAVWFFWRLGGPRFFTRSMLGFALSIVATLHIYLAARVTWLLFPAFLLYLAVAQREWFRRAWRPALAGLLLAGLLVLPMFVYLANHPAAQTRLEMLDDPLGQARGGNLAPLLHNAREALLAFVWPGYGDQFLAYNIPGRPVLDSATAVFFIIGILAALYRWRQPAHAFVLLWFLAGVLPSLITGPTANTTRNLAALPAVFLLPAIGFGAVLDGIRPRLRWRALAPVAAAIWLLFTGAASTRDYFVRWGESPEVRGAYQQTLVRALAYMDAQHPDLSPLVISTVYPGPAHDNSIALVLAAPRETRWVDARYALILPGGQNPHALILDSTPPHPAFQSLLQPRARVALRPDDLDPGFTLHDVDSGAIVRAWDAADAVNFGAAVRLLEARWLDSVVTPGATAELLTVWQVNDPARLGPIHPPAYTTETAVFVHLLDAGGDILAQRDALDAPSWSWQPGDVILHVHPVQIPDAIPAGDYAAVVGLYDRPSGARLNVLDAAGSAVETRAFTPPLRIEAAP
jgi:4-amino-4-deoxy-L-arabinose transferase-like glycosyltransferase